jgi:tetratricopeptide (TPR) repeat protein
MMWARVVTSALVVFATPAFAQVKTSDADEAFKQGRELLKAGKYDEACEQFEKSEHLDPQNGTRFNIAECDEHIGKVATALAIYRDLVAHDSNDKRKAASQQRIDELVKQVAQLVVQVAGKPAHLAVRLGDRRIEPNQPIELDYGDYTVSVLADGMADYTGKVSLQNPGRVVLAVVLAPAGGEPSRAEPEKPEQTDKPDKPDPEDDVQPKSHRKTYAIGAMTLGGGGVLASFIVGLAAKGKWNDAKAACGGSTTCTNQTDLATANALRADASSKATLATVLFIAGAAIAGGGVYLWLTDESGTHVSASASGDSATLMLSGRF